jgi:hypothetical protein
VIYGTQLLSYGGKLGGWEPAEIKDGFAEKKVLPARERGVVPVFS